MNGLNRLFDRSAGHVRSAGTRLGAAALLAAAVTASVLAAGGVQGRGEADRDDEHERGRTYEIGLWGDLPYSTLQATVGVPNLIADMNRQDLAFTLFAFQPQIVPGNRTAVPTP